MRFPLVRRPGVSVDYIPDGKGGATIHSYEDVGPQLVAIERKRDDDRLARRKKDMREVAQIPALVFNKWLVEEGMTMRDVSNNDAMHKFLKKKLNDPENRKFRTGPERL